MPIVAKGQITITDLNDGINGDNGKTYVLNILNGVRSVVYDANGKNPSPSQTAFSCELYEDGVLKTPSSYSWSATGLLSGTSASSTFTPTCAAAFSSTNNSVSLTVVYNKQTIRATIPIAITRIGASGNNAIIAVLSNETHTIPTDNSGNNGNFTGANTTMYIYNGATDDSSNWTVSATASNVTGSLSGKTYTITAMSADTGYVDLTASRSGYTSITKRFTLTKSKQGAAGSNGSNGAAGQNATAYKLISNVAAIAKSISNVYTPTTITFSATSATGTASPKAYAGRFIISETTDGKSYTAKYTSSANESSKIYTPSAGIKAINAKLYLAGGTTTLLDEQTIPIVSDGATGPKGDTGATGSAGVSITKVDVEYAVNTSTSTAPTTGWQTTTPTWVDGQYIWSRTKTTYSTGSSTYTNPACITGGKGATGATGSAGKGIKSTAITYQASTSGTTTPTGTWSSSIPTVSAGQYLWTKTVITYTDSTTSTSYSIGKMGEQGSTGSAGKGVSSTAVTYQASTSGTTTPTGTWQSTVPTVSAGQYLWTKTVITYTDSTTSTSYSIGKMGEQGPTGATGATGKGVSSITEEYYLSTSKTSQTGGSWTTTPPTWSTGKYVWTRSKIVYQNPASTVYTTPICDNSWEAINEFNTQENIFNTLTNNGATQGIYMQNNKLYLNGEYLKAGTVSADKLLIGIGDGGGLSQNPSFKKWSGTYPDGTVAWSSGGISKQTVDGRNVAQFTCSTSGTQYGMQLPSTFFANNINLDGVEYFALEVKFRLTSGTSPSGAAFLFDIYATDGTYQRLQLNMTEAGSSLTTNTWYTVKKVFQVSTTKTFKSCSGYLLANWSSAGNAVKTIQFATANVYIATKQDYLTQSWTTGTEINGASIKTGTLSASKITTGTLDASKVVVSNLNAGNITSGTISADRISVDTLKGKTITSGTISGGSITGATIKGGSIGIGGTSYNAFTVDTSGNLTINGGAFKVTSAGALTASNATIKGNVTASSGKIAGYTISGNDLIGSNVGMAGASGTNWAFWAGSNTSSTAPFRVGHDGSLIASNVNITGGSLGIGSNFSVTNAGVLTCSNASINGKVETKSIVGIYEYITTINNGIIESNAYLGTDYSEAGYKLEISPTSLKLFQAGGTSNTYTTLTTSGLQIKERDGYMVHFGNTDTIWEYDNYIRGNLLVSGGLLPTETDTGYGGEGMTSDWASYNTSVHFYTKYSIPKQPSQYGYLLNVGSGSEIHQMWMTQADGDMLHRGGNRNGWHGAIGGEGAWKTLLDSSNFSRYAIPTSASCNRNWYWSGQGGQPTWIWGGYDGTNMYVYNPSNFSVAWATGAGYANEWRSVGAGSSYIATGNGDNATWSSHNVIFRSWYGIGFRDHTDTCRILFDTRTGNVFAKGYVMASSFPTSSDRRLKEKIAPIDERLEKLFLELKPVNYYMINQDDHRRHNGFIAQEVEEAMKNNGIAYEEFAGLLKRKHMNNNENEEDVPIQILNDEEDLENVEYSLNYNEFTALNTHMIQKCLKRIKELEEQILELKK